MGQLLNKLKTQTRIATATLSGKIVQIPADVKNFNCPNHFVTQNGKQVKQKYMIFFNPRDKEFTCQCGTIYQKV